MMTSREERLIKQFGSYACHTEDCKNVTNINSIYECDCNCYELFWMRVGSSSIKAAAINLVTQCIAVDNTMQKLADAINDIE